LTSTQPEAKIRQTIVVQLTLRPVRETKRSSLPWGGRSTMRNLSKKRLGFMAGLALATAAAALAAAGGSRAASPNICTTSSSGTPPSTYIPSSCLTETLAPHTLAAGAPGLSITKFTNQSGAGGATATHTAITVLFSQAVTVVGPITLVVNGSVAKTNTCSPSTDPTTPTTVSCSDFGNTVGGSFDKVIIKYSVASPASVKVYAQVTYGDGGNDNSGGPNGTVNDSQVSNSDSTGVVDSKDGTVQSLCGSNTSVAGGDSTLNTKFGFTNAADGFLPCTPVTAGVRVLGGVNTHVAFIDFPQLSSPCATPTGGGQSFCYGTATLDFFAVPSGETWKNFVLYEALPPDFSFSINNRIIVPACDSHGLPPNPGNTPAAGPPQVNDTCVYSRSNLPPKGAELVLHALASPLDSSYSG
jgi:hypothetical protein